MKQHAKIWGGRTLAVVLLAVAAHQWAPPIYKQYFTKTEKVEYIPTAKVREGKFVVSFHEIGTVQAEKSVSVSTESGGKIIRLIDDGKTISSGNVIAEMDTTDIERELTNQQLAHRNALADVARAKAELEILKEANRTEVEQSQAQLDFDKTEVDRAKGELEKSKRLAKDRLVPGSDVEKAELTLKSKELAVKKGEMSLQLKTKEVKSKESQKEADVANVQFKADMARMQLEVVEKRLQSAVVTAPANGLVVLAKDWTPDGRRQIKEGDTLRPRQEVCYLPDLTSMQVKVSVGEADAPKLRLEMPTLVKLEAVPNKLYHGVVESISSLATEGSPWDAGSTPGRRTFEVTIAIKETDPKNLKPGMTADVEFLCSQIDKAVYVPIEAVIEQSGKTCVFIKKGRDYKRTNVTVGKRNDNFVCITKGCARGDVVALRDLTRSLDEQESGAEGSSEKDEEKPDKEKKPAPIPGAKEAGA